MMLRCFRGNPSAAEVIEALDVAAACAGVMPKYIVTDQGLQFREDYNDWCRCRGIKPRFGAIGQHGSIAVIERFNRTLKDECVRRIVIPLATVAFERELLSYARWYNEYRPHQTLFGRTPNEIYEGRTLATEEQALDGRSLARIARLASPETDAVSRAPPRLRLVIKHFENRRHLPVVELRRAA